jgi:hypothetical protein
MRLTPRTPDTAPPLTVFRVWVDPRHAWMNLCQISKSIWGRIRFPAENVDPTIPTPTDRGKLSKAGWVRLRECPRHGCRGQAPGTGLRRLPQPDPPAHLDSQLLPLTLIRQVQGCKPCRPLPAGRKRSEHFQDFRPRGSGDGPAPAASAGAGWPGRRHRALRRPQRQQRRASGRRPAFPTTLARPRLRAFLRVQLVARRRVDRLAVAGTVSSKPRPSAVSSSRSKRRSVQARPAPTASRARASP